MNKQQKLLLLVFSLIMAYSMFFILGYSLGQNTKKEKLEQELCKLEKYKYCNEEEKLKIIEKQLLKK